MSVRGKLPGEYSRAKGERRKLGEADRDNGAGAGRRFTGGHGMLIGDDGSAMFCDGRGAFADVVSAAPGCGRGQVQEGGPAVALTTWSTAGAMGRGMASGDGVGEGGS
ncbi:hypothetical protein PSPO01_16008 [Paraphaeosphaeria sporulosa]